MFAASLSGRARWVGLAMVTLVALLASLLAVLTPPAVAHAEVTGTGGQFVPMTNDARVFNDTTPAGGWRTVAIAGVDGLPSEGIGAVSMLISIISADGQGKMVGRPNSSEDSTTLTIYGTGLTGDVSTTAVLAVSDGGNIQISTSTAQTKIVIDVTGYSLLA